MLNRAATEVPRNSGQPRAELAVSLARESEELKARIATLERQLVAT